MNAPLPRGATSLDDKYRVDAGWVYLSGTQALTRLPLQQRLRDEAAGLKTAGYISGYRGSPLGRYDMELWSQAERLKQHNIVFRPGINEDLAATAIWGSQYIGILPGSAVDGVFGIWYGKGPGVDRSGDAFRHAAIAGSGKLGGVLAIAGDDHASRSSTIANFSDPIFIAAGMPVLYPSNTQELLDFGLHGIAMSRHSGCWVGMKVHADVVEGGGSVVVAPDAPTIVLPPLEPPAALGPQGLNIRGFDPPLLGEQRLHQHKLPAALGYARANQLNRIVFDAPTARLGVLAAGKSFQDVMQALAELGIGESRARELQLRVGKIGMVWPLDPQFVTEFSRDLEAIIVVEEKRPILEDQIKSVLFDARPPHLPRVIGKLDGAPAYTGPAAAAVFPNWGELAPPLVAQTLVRVAGELQPPLHIAVPLAPQPLAAAGPASPVRLPGFCSGCPHNRSTRVPDGSRAMVGIGCHGMATIADPTKTPPMFTQMGAEGMHWLGQQPFTQEKHVFVNMGDGTYFHSGFLAIRQALAAQVAVTYKILVNGFVSMTGGQPIDGELSVNQIVSELQAEGMQEIVVLTDDLSKHPAGSLPAGVPVLPRTELAAQMQRLRAYPKPSAIVYDQPCATERRRLRKRGKWADPPKRSYINAAVCEGCGECSKVSGCLSIEPLETPFGRKRVINQSSCNKDFSCVEGFCPSFVTVHGGALRRTKPAAPTPAQDAGAAQADFLSSLPAPTVSKLERDHAILVTGVGGTGVVTIGQVLGMAAHLDGLAVSVLDETGLAQKYGSVMSHVRIAPDAQRLHATRIATGEADAVIGCDLVVTAGDEATRRLRHGHTTVVVATDVVPTSDFSRNPDWSMDAAALLQRIRERSGANVLAINAQHLATALLGDSIAANMMMLGAAWQSGAVPLSLASLERAIELNGVQIEFNKRCLAWGRRCAADMAAVQAAALPARSVSPEPQRPETLADIVERNAAVLRDYQNDAYAQRYRQLVGQASRAEQRLGMGDGFALAVARYHFKLLAHKDEFEVARLYASEAFQQELRERFEGDYKLHFHLGAWPFGGVDAQGQLLKGEVGPWMMPAFKVLARLRGLRGTWLDPFRHGAERQLALRLLQRYESDIGLAIKNLDAECYESAIALAAQPDKIRGYGPVRERHVAALESERERLLQALSAGRNRPLAQAA